MIEQGAGFMSADHGVAMLHFPLVDTAVDVGQMVYAPYDSAAVMVLMRGYAAQIVAIFDGAHLPLFLVSQYTADEAPLVAGIDNARIARFPQY